MDTEQFAALFREGCGAIGMAPRRDVVDRFLVYAGELRRWNEKINLTGHTHEREIIGNLFVDSLIWAGVVEQNTSCAMLDVGSGAGFPGLPIGMVSPQHEMTLLEPNLKKVAFLHHLIGLLGLTNVRVESSRVEQLSEQRECHGKFDWVLLKALRLNVGLPYVSSLLSASGKCAVWRARPVDADPGLKGFSVAREMPYTLPFGFGERRLSIVERVNEGPAGTVSDCSTWNNAGRTERDWKD